MAYGLQIYNASGNLRLEISDRTAELYTETAVSVSGGTGTASVPGMDTSGEWEVAYADSATEPYISVDIQNNQFVVSGSDGTYDFNVVRF